MLDEWEVCSFVLIPSYFAHICNSTLVNKVCILVLKREPTRHLLVYCNAAMQSNIINQTTTQCQPESSTTTLRITHIDWNSAQIPYFDIIYTRQGSWVVATGSLSWQDIFLGFHILETDSFGYLKSTLDDWCSNRFWNFKIQKLLHFSQISWHDPCKHIPFLRLATWNLPCSCKGTGDDHFHADKSPPIYIIGNLSNNLPQPWIQHYPWLAHQPFLKLQSPQLWHFSTISWHDHTSYT